MESAWIATPFPLLDSHAVHQLSDDTFWSWNGTTLTWTQIAGGPSTGFYNPSFVTVTGTPISAQSTILRVGADSTHELSIASGQCRIIHQYDPFLATITLPAGMQFSNNRNELAMGEGDVYELAFFQSETFPNNKVLIKSYNGGIA